ncbi:MAG: hypothetical protein IJX84_11255 [Clostridia bacterium]|nr:hypothetical protein [Clostridia bacterium]
MCEKNKKPQETIELTDDQLDNVVGGAKIGDRTTRKCPLCGASVLHEYRKGAEGEGWYCTVCGSRRYEIGFLMVGNTTRPGTELM